MTAPINAGLDPAVTIGGPITGTNPVVTAAGIAGLGTGTVTSVSVTPPLTVANPTTTPALSTSIATGKLVGRTTAATGVMEEITPDATLALAAGALGRAALTGDVTAAAGSNATVVTALSSATTSVNVNAATAPTTGQVLTATGASAATWQTPTAALTQPQVMARQSFGGF